MAPRPASPRRNEEGEVAADKAPDGRPHPNPPRAGGGREEGTPLAALTDSYFLKTKAIVERCFIRRCSS